MIYFKGDYIVGVHPKVMDALVETIHKTIVKTVY